MDDDKPLREYVRDMVYEAILRHRARWKVGGVGQGEGAEIIDFEKARRCRKDGQASRDSDQDCPD